MKKKSQPAEGVLRVHSRGFGFLQPDDRSRFPEDIFVPKQRTEGAIDGDRVRVEIVPSPYSDKGPEGRVTAILERSRNQLAVTVYRLEKDGSAYAHSPLLGEELVFIERPSKRRLKVGDRFVLEMFDWGNEHRAPQGEILHFIGPLSDPSKDVQAAIAEFELDHVFPPEVLKEVKAFGTTVKKKDLRDREDLRSLETFTIDPETAKDFDDALTLSRDQDGPFHLVVHIADVSHYVRPNTALDDEAQRRCNSTYFPGEVVPMLPHELSSHLCSLQPHVDRLAVSVFVTIDPSGDVLDSRVTKSVIHSDERYTYEQARDILAGKEKSAHTKTLHLMQELCLLLKKQRAKRGSIEFALPEVVVRVDPKGDPQGIEIIEYDVTHQLVEEFMLKANEIVATKLFEENKPLSYRIHEAPNPSNLAAFASLATRFGYTLSSEPTSPELQALFDAARNEPHGQFLATAFIRSLKLASYSPDNIGHWGLNLEHYTHFTSPIRRYIDLVVHRVLFDESPSDLNLNEVSEQCSLKERLSAKAEGRVKLLKKLRLLDRLHKENPKRSYKAVITSAKPFGLAFEVEEVMVEGFVHISLIDSDYYDFDEKAGGLIGADSGKQYLTGDTISVKLDHLNLIDGQTSWRIV